MSKTSLPSVLTHVLGTNHLHGPGQEKLHKCMGVHGFKSRGELIIILVIQKDLHKVVGQQKLLIHHNYSQMAAMEHLSRGIMVLLVNKAVLFCFVRQQNFLLLHIVSIIKSYRE